MPSYITIFGATGNLMVKKLIPALASLLASGNFDQNTKILAVARKPYSTEDYLTEMKKQVKENIDFDQLSKHLEYISMDVSSLNDFTLLNEHIEKNGKNPTKVFYLAVAPQLFPQIAKGISEAGLIKKGETTARIVFEKPFGEDLQSAKAINQLLWQYFDESQIYRIDHYLGKEMIQNILVMRFANKIFENNWNHIAIKRVFILAKETEGVMNRGGYYDTVGALKDMVQSHLMQMAALTAMEVPKRFDANGIREQKVDVMQHITIDPKHVVMGQYAGYLQENNIPADSKTETLVFLKARIHTPRWQNVPFYFYTGKKLSEKRSEIIIEFKANSEQKKLWEDEVIGCNRLSIQVAPLEGVKFTLNVKEPGLSDSIRKAELDYCHACQVMGNLPEAYERLLLDVMRGQSTLFTRWDEIESSWKIIEDLQAMQKTPIIYQNESDVKHHVNALFGEEIL